MRVRVRVPEAPAGIFFHVTCLLELRESQSLQTCLCPLITHTGTGVLARCQDVRQSLTAGSPVAQRPVIQMRTEPGEPE